MTSPTGIPSFDIRTWLEGLGFGAYAEAFIAQDIDLEALLVLTQEDLKECGMTSMGHRKKLLLAIQALKEERSGARAAEEKSEQARHPLEAAPRVESSSPAPAAAVIRTDRIGIPPAPENRPSGGEPARAPDTIAPPAAKPSGPGDPARSEPQVEGSGHMPLPGVTKEKEEKPPLLTRIGRAYRKASGGSMLLSIAVHAVILIIGTYLVVSQIVEERKISFGGGEAGPKSEVQHKVKRKTTTTAPAPTKRITTTSSIAKVALPDMPDIPTNMGPSIAGAMGSGGFGAAGGLGGGGGGGGGSGGGKGNGFSKITFFGLNTSGKSTGLTGTFYDLKQSQGGRPTGMTPESWTKVAQDFTRTWNPGELSKYFKGPKQLSLAHLYIPSMNADEGPKAFELEKKVEPRMWLVLYKGEIIAPMSGRFRFVSHGDDTVIVRFNNKTVLEYGQPDAGKLTDWKPSEQPVKYPKSSRYGLMPGNWIDVTQGQSYPVEILIGERPGGKLAFVLLVEEPGKSYEKSNGVSILPLFRVGGSDLPKEDWLPFAKQGPVWKIKASSSLSSYANP